MARAELNLQAQEGWVAGAEANWQARQAVHSSAWHTWLSVPFCPIQRCVPPSLQLTCDAQGARCRRAYAIASSCCPARTSSTNSWQAGREGGRGRGQGELEGGDAGHGMAVGRMLALPGRLPVVTHSPSSAPTCTRSLNSSLLLALRSRGRCSAHQASAGPAGHQCWGCVRMRQSTAREQHASSARNASMQASTSRRR